MTRPTDPTLLEWLFAWEAMRRLGFTADELFFVVNPPGYTLVHPDGAQHVSTSGCSLVSLAIRAQGKEFRVTIGETPLVGTELSRAHADACAWWQTDTTPIERTGYLASQVVREAPLLVIALQERGFALARSGAWS